MDDFELTFETGKDLIKQIEKEIYQFNFSQIGKYKYEPLSICARDKNNKIIGSLIGTIGLNWLYIDMLWVAKKFRGSGLGTKIINKAESEAKKKSCIGIYLYTYSFQSPKFYEKLGFVKVGELTDFPFGHQKYFMKKQLSN
jgi:ribosomal protein S18 acetylase RimI-like enzyme